MRLYDRIEIIEKDTYIINKILKLSVLDNAYFNAFEKLLEDISFIQDIQNIVKFSTF